MKSLLTILSTLLISSAATAESPLPTENLFTCTFDGGKHKVEILMFDGVDQLPKINYAYGEVGKEPALVFVAESIFVAMSGVPVYQMGKNNPEKSSITITKDNFYYEVSDLNNDNGELSVLKDGANGSLDIVFSKSCDKGSTVTNLATLQGIINRAN